MALLTIAPQGAHVAQNLSAFAKQLDLLAPHLVRAAALNRVAALAQLSERTIGEILQAFAPAVLLLDRAHGMVAANGRGEALMAREQVLRFDRWGRVRAARPADDRAFKAALANADLARGPAHSPVRLLSCRSGRTWLAWVVPTRPLSSDEACWRFRLVEAQPTATALVVVTPADAVASVPVEAIEAAFGLSKAEARLASALVAGRTLAEFADQSGHSRTTVRNQLAAVFEKTGTHRQSELVLLISSRLATVARTSRRSA